MKQIVKSTEVAMIIELTGDQQKKLQGLMGKITIMARRGEPGIADTRRIEISLFIRISIMFFEKE